MRSTPLKYTFSFLVALLLASGPGCKHSEKAMAAPSDLQIMVGQGGGFAGRMTGYTIGADGSVVEWEGKYPGENKRADAPADKERAAALWQQAVEANILETSQQEVGNMTWFVNVRADGQTRRVSWSEWPEDRTTLSDAQAFYNACVEAARAALTK